MDIANSKLAQNYASLAQELDTVMREAQSLGAQVGVERVALLCDQYDKISPDVAYRWMDPGEIQREVEEAQGHKVEVVHILRNCASLLPLILTWFALFFAANSYQNYLKTHAGDNQSFLSIWQNGFDHTTSFTFAVAAISDVMLLLLYLAFIILTFVLERRAHITSLNFSRKLRNTTEKLMKAIASEGIITITSGADVDQVAHAISRVVDNAMNMNKSFIEETRGTLEEAMKATQQSTLQAVQSAQESSQQIVQVTQQSTLASIQALQQSIEQIMQTTHRSTLDAIQASQQSTQQVAQTARQVVTDSHTTMEEMFDDEITPMLQTFNKDMVSLHKELGNYQGRLNDLTAASTQISKASEALVTNADRYITIGKEIGEQIAALNSTQQQVLTQIGSIAGNIGSAARDMNAATISMNTATQSMSAATHAVESIAMQMSSGMQTTINTMTNQVGRATQSLGQVGNELQATSFYLQKAATLLSSVQLGSRGGLIGWLFSRRANRRKGARAANP